HRHQAAPTRELQQLRDHLGARRDVDLAKRDAPCDELGALAVEPGTARPGVEDDRRGGSHQTSVDATRVAAALNIPPRPWQIASRQSGTWRAPHSPRSCRTASISVKMPYIPVCVYDRPPPLVFIGKSPPWVTRQQSRRWSGHEIMREASTSSTVNGSRMSARGFKAAHLRVATATSASCSLAVPNSCMWRAAASA